MSHPWFAISLGDPTPHDGTLVRLSSIEALKGFFGETNRISTRIVPSMAFLSMRDLKLTSATASMKIDSSSNSHLAEPCAFELSNVMFKQARRYRQTRLKHESSLGSQGLSKYEDSSPSWCTDLYWMSSMPSMP